MSTALTDEHYRILRAAADYRLRSNSAGRWVIFGEPRPDRKSRERLTARGLIGYGKLESGRIDYDSLTLTDKGREALAARP